MYKRKAHIYIIPRMTSNVGTEDQCCSELAKARKAFGFLGVDRESIWSMFVAEADGVVVVF